MVISQVHFSSQCLAWQTPDHTYKELDQEFGFDYDPCPVNHGIHDKDGLGSDWGKINFVNPPYGREIGKWIKKGYEEHLKGKTVVFLIPSRTDTKWWHDYCMKAKEIRFIKGRLEFKHPEKGTVDRAPFPSAIIIFQT